jgi:hypothetical protein
VIEDKIITWKNLQKRGWVGPGFYHLCKGNQETGNHLFFTSLLLVKFGK